MLVAEIAQTGPWFALQPKGLAQISGFPASPSSAVFFVLFFFFFFFFFFCEGLGHLPTLQKTLVDFNTGALDKAMPREPNKVFQNPPVSVHSSFFDS